MPEQMAFRKVTGEPVTHEVSYGAEGPAGDYLRGRIVRFDDGIELLEHRPVNGPQRREAYERLDNEILAGRQLHELADWSYPTQVAKLYGDEPNSADPFALFEPYQGSPLRDVGLYMGDHEFDAFLTGLLTGLCWIAAAGIAHQMISQDTVLWDSERGVLITDFSRSTIFGVRRTTLDGYDGWVPKELRQGRCAGTVGPRDDIWAAGQLIYFVGNQGEEPQDRSQLADLDAMFNGLFDPIFGPVENRPTARELLEDGLGRRVNVPSEARRSERLKAGRESFLEVRTRKHAGAVTPPDFNADLDWMGVPADRPAAPANGDHPDAVGTAAADGASVCPPAGTDGDAADTTAGAGGTTRFKRRRGAS